MEYRKSVELALSKGYEEVQDTTAYRGRYFVKDGLIWVHEIDALKTSLGITSDQELRQANYDVDSYYKYRDYSNEKVDSELLGLYEDLNLGDGEPVYLMDGEYLFPDGHIGEL